MTLRDPGERTGHSGAPPTAVQPGQTERKKPEEESRRNLLENTVFLTLGVKQHSLH